jgi:nucleotide-binding universal stress UspA family protein
MSLPQRHMEQIMSLDHPTRALQDYLRAEQYLSVERSLLDAATRRRETARRELQGVMHSATVSENHPLAGTIQEVLAGNIEPSQVREKPKEQIRKAGNSDTPAQPLILVAVDDSDPALWAVSAAGRLAQRLGARVLLMNVVNPIEVFAPEVHVPTDYNSRLREAAESVLETARELLPRNVEAATLIEEGDPAMKVALLSQERAAEYVFIGTHGRGRVGQLLLGSTATAVARLATCPVIVVSHPQEKAQATTTKRGKLLERLVEKLNPAEVPLE